jgi:hypothetical protein
MTLFKFGWGLSGKIMAAPDQHNVQDVLGPAVKLVALPVNGTAFPPPKWIIGNAAGTASITDCFGDTLLLFPITGGEQHIACTAINTLVTTAKVWGAY